MERMKQCDSPTPWSNLSQRPVKDTSRNQKAAVGAFGACRKCLVGVLDEVDMAHARASVTLDVGVGVAELSSGC